MTEHAALLGPLGCLLLVGACSLPQGQGPGRPQGEGPTTSHPPTRGIAPQSRDAGAGGSAAETTSSGAESGGSRTVLSPPVPSSGCLPPGAPLERSLEAHLAKINGDNIEAALKSRGLERLALRMAHKELHRGLEPRAPILSETWGQEVKTTVEGVAGTYVAGDVFWGLMGTLPEPWLFVKDPQGNLFRLVTVAKPTVGHPVVLCGCTPRVCGPYGSGCPGCGSTVQRLYGPLPPGLSFKGTVEVPYEHHRLERRYAKTKCPSEPCPPPPPSMAW